MNSNKRKLQKEKQQQQQQQQQKRKSCIEEVLSHLHGTSNDIKIKSPMSTTKRVLNVFRIILSM